MEENEPRGKQRGRNKEDIGLCTSLQLQPSYIRFSFSRRIVIYRPRPSPQMNAPTLAARNMLYLSRSRLYKKIFGSKKITHNSKNKRDRCTLVSADWALESRVLIKKYEFFCWGFMVLPKGVFLITFLWISIGFDSRKIFWDEKFRICHNKFWCWTLEFQFERILH